MRQWGWTAAALVIILAMLQKPSTPTAAGPSYDNLPQGQLGFVVPVPDWQDRITAGFYTRDCAYWGPGAANQPNCQHFGTDIGGDGEGTEVRAPYSGTVIGCVDNGDSGSFIGKWIEYTLEDGTVLLINHFRHVEPCTPGAWIHAGQLLGTMRGDANHVHVQVTENGRLVDFVDYVKRH